MRHAASSSGPDYSSCSSAVRRRGVQHIRLQEVLRTVGLTTGAAYRIWADQDDFHRDLAVELVRLRLAARGERHRYRQGDHPRRRGHGASVTAAARPCELHLPLPARGESRDSHALHQRPSPCARPQERGASCGRRAPNVTRSRSRTTATSTRCSWSSSAATPAHTVAAVRDFAEAMAALGEGFAVRAAKGLDHPILRISDEARGARRRPGACSASPRAASSTCSWSPPNERAAPGVREAPSDCRDLLSPPAQWVIGPTNTAPQRARPYHSPRAILPRRWAPGTDR